VFINAVKHTAYISKKDFLTQKLPHPTTSYHIISYHIISYHIIKQLYQAFRGFKTIFTILNNAQNPNSAGVVIFYYNDNRFSHTGLNKNFLLAILRNSNKIQTLNIKKSYK
jgi:hypothetical protein